MNLLDYYKEELNKCQNINDAAKLLAVFRHLTIVYLIEQGYSERAIASKTGVSNTRIGQIKRNLPKENK